MTTYAGSILVGTPENLTGAYIPDWNSAPVDYHKQQIAVDVPPVPFMLRGPLTNNLPVSIESRNTLGIRMPGFFDDFYNRVHIEPALVDAGNVSSTQIRNIVLFNGFFTPLTIDAILASDAEGITLTGITAPTLVGPLVTIPFTATISTEGPPDINGGFLFQFDIYNDIELHFNGSRVIVLPYQAESGFEEELEWVTEVLTSNNGTEQRIQHRQKPRQKFSGSYFVPSTEVARADSIVYGWIGKRWAIAVWSESQIIQLEPAGDTIVCETGTTDIRVGGLIMIWSSANNYEVIEVAAVNPTNIVLTRATVNSYPRALLMPVRSGLGTDRMKIVKNGFDARVFTEFEVTDNTTLTATVPAQFLGEDIYYEESLMGDSGFTDEYQNRVDRVDYGTTIEIYSPWLNKKITRNVHFVCQNRSESWTFRQWLHRRDGKQKPYWLPTFESNFELAMTGLVSNSLICRNNDWRGLSEARVHVAIEYTDLTWRATTITGSAVVDANTFSIAINTSLNVDASRIKRISLLGLKRLDTNVVRLNWIGNAVCEADIPILEITP